MSGAVAGDVKDGVPRPTPGVDAEDCSDPDPRVRGKDKADEGKRDRATDEAVRVWL